MHLNYTKHNKIFLFTDDILMHTLYIKQKG